MKSGQITEIERVFDLSSERFRDQYQHRRPIVVASAASSSPAAIKWTLPYLVETIGDAKISVLQYDDDPRDFIDAVKRVMLFRDFAHEMFGASPSSRNLYFFNVTGANFWANDTFDPPPGVNPDLALLVPDFVPPSFVNRADLIYAQLVLGSMKNGTTLHYDWGGEAKLLMQLRGRKDVILFAPSETPHLYLNRLFCDDHGWPALSRADVRQMSTDRFPELACARAWHTILEPGDVLYWPSFWFHDIVNLDPFTLAVNAPIDELPVTPLLVRQLIGSVVASLLSRQLSIERERHRRELLPILADLENLLLSNELAGRNRLWSWAFQPKQLQAG